MDISLNEKQKEAVEQTDGPLLILAGAGAGKTKTITERVVRLVRKGVAPNNILAVTFTNKAAKEMLERIDSRLLEEKLVDPGHRFDRPTIKTFHSLGLLVIRENAGDLGLLRNVRILDDGESLSIIKERIISDGLDPKQFEPRRFRSLISREKGNFVKLEEYERNVAGYIPKILASVWRGYENELKRQKAVDFDDLLVKAVTLLKERVDLREKYQNRFKYIHVDEYQDTNQAQYEFSKLLAEKNRNICVVGDADQNIYSWRGANLKNILNFERDYPEAKVVILEENYRSTQTILKAANEIIKKNVMRKEKNLFTRRGEGEKITVLPCYDETVEALYIAEKIQELIKGGVEPKNMAVLYRANFQSRTHEEALLRENIPYQVLGVRFFERKEVKDVLAYLRAGLNNNNSFDVARAASFPSRGLGKVAVTKILSDRIEELPTGAKTKSKAFMNLLKEIGGKAGKEKLSDTLLYIVKHSGIEKTLSGGTEEDLERLENVRELVSLATKYDSLQPEEALEKFLEESALVSDQDDLKEEKNAVRLMTVHSSKGLEFEYVFVTGLEQDLFPHRKLSGGNITKEESEEERRLFYVALTRAKEKLFLSYAELRTIFGSKQINAPSEFLSDIPEELTDMEDTSGARERRNIIYLD